MDIIAVWLIDSVFFLILFLQDCGTYCMLSHKLISSC